MEFKHVGVVGAGVMGIGLAQNLAQTKHHVILLDISEEILAKALKEIKKNVRLSRLYNKGQEHEPVAEVMKRITTTTDYAPFKDADFVVENAVEKWDIKKEIYPQLDAVCPEHCVFAANTSCISITKIGSVTNRPDRIVGMHFMNPVPMKPMVEVIRGYHTTDESIGVAEAFLASMNKTCVVVNDMPGFVSNRILMLTVNEAAYTVQDGVATAAQVDEIFRSCFGHAMGPLETADLIGLDTILYSVEVLYESYSDSKYRPCPLLIKMVDAGLLGRKSGEGFHKYN